MNININPLIKKLLPYIFLFLAAYFINTVIFLFLPKSGVEYIKNNDSTLEYKKYSGFYSNIIEVEKKEKARKQKVESLTKYKLKAIYSKDDNSGWIIVEEFNGNKSHILSQWEEIEGYILTKLYKKYVIFEKTAKEFKLELTKEKGNISYEVTKNISNNLTENIVVKDDITTVNREYLNSYVNNIDKVWSNISIQEIRKDKKIEGFKIYNVTKGSAFDKLGLKKGDIIKAINNKTLNSYADAFKVYNNINNTKYLNIEVLRNNEVMELNYEID